METIDFAKLPEEQQELLLKQAEERIKSKKDNQRAERQSYKELVDETIKNLVPQLEYVSNELSRTKRHVFESLQTLITMKADLYDRKEDQNSHSFTTTDGMFTISIGRNVNDGWDDTVNTGIAKVNDFINLMAKDENSKRLVNAILRLLSKDKKGNLKASRVLELKKMAEESGDPLFLDAITIIQDAYRSTPSAEFVWCKGKDEKGEFKILPLSITEANMTVDEKMETKLTLLEEKAQKWDELDEEIGKLYELDENLEELPENEGVDLDTIGEIAARAFGFL